MSAKKIRHLSLRVPVLDALDVLCEYAKKLVSNMVGMEDMLITKRLSKSPSDYNPDVFQASVAKQLKKAGFKVSSCCPDNSEVFSAGKS